jgi:hypothetical protein
VFPPVPATLVGSDGTDCGVADADVVLYELVPAEFVAATLNTYATPLVKPVIVALVAVDVPSLNVDHVEPLLDEN